MCRLQNELDSKTDGMSFQICDGDLDCAGGEDENPDEGCPPCDGVSSSLALVSILYNIMHKIICCFSPFSSNATTRNAFLVAGNVTECGIAEMVLTNIQSVTPVAALL